VAGFELGQVLMSLIPTSHVCVGFGYDLEQALMSLIPVTFQVYLMICDDLCV
jgi:hypothetical protein